ncbi:hypothetical protein GT623_07810, partial [Burkholderia thailandensis]|nr:hypothetical protein [Burkholderia thailandensis]
SWKDRKPLAAAIKPIYQAATAEAAAAVTFRHKGAGYFRHIGASRSG